MPFEKDVNELGALWSHQSPKGEYLTGTIEVNGQKINVVCFKTTKAKDTHPDWRVLKSVPKADRPATPRTDVDASDVPF